MAKTQFEPKLRRRAEQFISALEGAGLEGAVLDDSFREYSVKVFVSRGGSDLGRVVLYHKPTSDSFSIGTQEIKDKSIAQVLKDCWDERDAVRSSTRHEFYVDGSYSNGKTGYGVVILEDGEAIEEFFGMVASAEVAGTHQVAGELAAVKEALKWCGRHSVNAATIYYDYLGIEKWATGAWKTNQPLTREYARFVRECGINIHWRKVASHTGNRWNDRADALAKKGAGSVEAPEGQSEMADALSATIAAWIEFLMVRGIEASFDRVYNEQFARVNIIEADKSVGTFDLYNTRKKRLSPYLHDFRNEELKDRIESLWKEFRESTM